MQRILFLANISNAIYKSSNLFTEAKIFDEGEELLLNIFPHSLSSSWPGVTLTMHTMIADEKPVDLCPLFIDAHNSKVPLSALLIVGALKFYARSRTILWCCKRALHCYAPWGTLALACLLIKWFWHRVALLCGSTNQISVKRFLLAVLVFWPRCCKNASFVCVGTLELAAFNC